MLSARLFSRTCQKTLIRTIHSCANDLIRAEHVPSPFSLCCEWPGKCGQPSWLHPCMQPCNSHSCTGTIGGTAHFYALPARDRCSTLCSCAFEHRRAATIHVSSSARRQDARLPNMPSQQALTAKDRVPFYFVIERYYSERVTIVVCVEDASACARESVCLWDPS